MSERLYIDSYAMVGRRGLQDVETPYRTEDLLDEMEWCGIHGALVGHWTAKEFDPVAGNRMLLQELKKSPRLYGVWTVMPPHTGEMAQPRQVVEEMLDHGIHAAKMYPRAHRYPFNVDYCGSLLAELQNRRILLLVEGGHMYNPDIFEPSNQVLLSELDAVLTRYPRLPVLLQASRWEATRYLTWLMRRHRNLHLELSNHQGNRAMEVFTEWFGVERIIFGTGALDKAPGAAKAFVDYCTLDNERKAQVAGLNLARLLDMKKMPAPYRSQPKGDSILASAKAGKPLKNTLVIDAHAHINEDGAEGVGFMHMPASDAAGMVERARTMGIDAMCVSSFLAIWVGDETGNDIVWRAMRSYPHKFHGYASLEPQYVKDWEAACRKWHLRKGMGGMKPYYPRTAIPYNDKVWNPWYEFGNRINAYALIHPSPNVGAEVSDLAVRFPNISFILAHTGASFHDARIGIEVAKNNPNVYLEITLTSVTHRVIEFMVNHVGAERVLFGTDQPMRDPIPQFGWMAYTRCTVPEKKKMLGLNMKKILERVRR